MSTPTSFLTRTVYVSSSTRRGLETLSKLHSPDGTSEQADALAEQILSAHLAGIPKLAEMNQRISEFFRDLNKTLLRGEAPDELP